MRGNPAPPGSGPSRSSSPRMSARGAQAPVWGGMKSASRCWTTWWARSTLRSRLLTPATACRGTQPSSVRWAGQPLPAMPGPPAWSTSSGRHAALGARPAPVLPQPTWAAPCSFLSLLGASTWARRCGRHPVHPCGRQGGGSLCLVGLHVSTAELRGGPAGAQAPSAAQEAWRRRGWRLGPGLGGWPV